MMVRRCPLVAVPVLGHDAHLAQGANWLDVGTGNKALDMEVGLSAVHDQTFGALDVPCARVALHQRRSGELSSSPLRLSPPGPVDHHSPVLDRQGVG